MIYKNHWLLMASTSMSTQFWLRNSLMENRSMAVMRHVGEVYLGHSLDAFAEEVIMRTQLIQCLLENTATMLAATKEDVHTVVHPSSEGDDEADDNLLLFDRNSDSTLANIR